jgi:hypothetical protein
MMLMVPLLVSSMRHSILTRGKQMTREMREIKQSFTISLVPSSTLIMYFLESHIQSEPSATRAHAHVDVEHWRRDWIPNGRLGLDQEQQFLRGVQYQLRSGEV